MNKNMAMEYFLSSNQLTLNQEITAISNLWLTLKFLKYPFPQFHFRCPGPAATDIAWIGSGSADAFFHMGIHIWDMAS